MNRLPKEDRAGLYITVIVHLTVIIVLLGTQIHRTIAQESSFILDFTREEELERLQQVKEQLQKEVAFKQEISSRIDEMIASGQTPVRNVAVDRSMLKDDRGTDAKKLYEDAERLKNELQNGFEGPEEDYADLADKQGKPVEKKEVAEYKGAAVVDYDLGGRRMTFKKVPAYKCENGGTVKVLITVDKSGKVIRADVDRSVSSNDSRMQYEACQAARLTRFKASSDAPDRQEGYIVYKFIAQ